MIDKTLRLKPFQEEGVRFLTETRNALLADDMGLGKTVQVVAAMNRLGCSSVVVICPAQVKIHWARTIKRWADKPLSVFIVEGGKAQIPHNANVIVVNYELLLRARIYKQLVARGENYGYDAVVMDEAHFLKNINAQRTKKVLGKGSFLRHSKRRWALTGTPVLNRPVELYPLAYTLAPQCIEPYLSYKAFTERYCAARFDPIMRELNVKGASHVAELASRIEPFMLRRKLEDVESQLPSVVETVVDVAGLTLAGLDSLPMSSARRELALAKIPFSLSYIRDTVEQVGKVVVFAHHRDVIQSLESGLSDLGAVVCYGGMDANQKQRSIDSFVNSPSTQVFIAQTVAGGTGVDGLQGVCNYAIFIELDWSPGIMDQAVARLRRIGQQNTVFVHYLSAPGTMDEDMEQLLRHKRDVISRLILAKEITPVTLESTLERIAIALEKMAVPLNSIVETMGSAAYLVADSISDAPPTPTSVEVVPAPAPKKAAPKKKEAPVPEPEPEVGEAIPEPAATEAVPTRSADDCRKELARYIREYAGADAEKKAKVVKFIKTSVWTQFKTPDGATPTTFDEVDPQFYGELYEVFQTPAAEYLDK